MSFRISKRGILIVATVAMLSLPGVRMFQIFGAAFTAGHTAPRARVVIVQDSQATDAFRARPERIREMVSEGITNLTRTPSVPDAWRTIVSTQDVVGIKVFSAPGANSGTRPAVVAAVVEGLLAAGVAPKHIVVWDRQITELRLAGFYDLAKRYGIRIAASQQAGYDEKAYYDMPLPGTLIWGDLEFGKKGGSIGRKSFVSKLLTRDISKIINITPLLNHDLAGVTGNLYSLAMGSVDNTVRFEKEAEHLAQVVPEIYALTNLSDHVVLNITDALICQYEGEERGLLHYSAVLDQLRFSRDPVALDLLSLKELDAQRRAANAPKVKPNPDLYDNAALLWLGVGNTNQIDIEMLKISANEPQAAHEFRYP
jgi:uncharacterized protein (DUF362 family)